jgi:hypothetical protein
MEIKKQEKIEEIKRFTGLIPYRIVALNPTLEELHKLGYTYLTQEPVYTTDDGGLRLDFMVENASGMDYLENGTLVNSGKLTNKYIIFLKPGDQTSSTGKVMIVNDLLQHSWSADLETLMSNERMEWFSKNHNIRVAKEGEVDLLILFRTLCGLSLGSKEKSADEVKFKTSWSEILNGNLTELRGYIAQAFKSGNGVTFLQYIKTTAEGKMYSTLYTKHIQTATNKQTKMFEKALSEYTPANCDYQDSLKFQLYTGTSTPKADVSPAVKSDW